MIEGCIFDLDGVIVDTAHYHYLAWKRLANELGYDLTEKENEQLKGVSRMRSLEIILEQAGVSLNQEHKEMLAAKKNAWFNDYVQQMQPEEIFPGVRTLIRNMRGRGIKVGLASSSRNARTVVRLLNIQSEFDAIVDGSMITRTKPDPEIFLKTAKLMGIQPADCVVVEDAEAGVQAALAAGMKCIGIGSSKILHRADRVFSKTSEVRLSTLDEISH